VREGASRPRRGRAPASGQQAEDLGDRRGVHRVMGFGLARCAGEALDAIHRTSQCAHQFEPTRVSRSRSTTIRSRCRPAGYVELGSWDISMPGCSHISSARNSIGPLNQWPDGHLIVALSTGPSDDSAIYRLRTSAGSAHRTVPSAV